MGGKDKMEGGERLMGSESHRSETDVDSYIGVYYVG